MSKSNMHRLSLWSVVIVILSIFLNSKARKNFKAWIKFIHTVGWLIFCIPGIIIFFAEKYNNFVNSIDYEEATYNNAWPHHIDDIVLVIQYIFCVIKNEIFLKKSLLFLNEVLVERNRQTYPKDDCKYWGKYNINDLLIWNTKSDCLPMWLH